MHSKTPKFSKFSGGEYPRTPLESCAFGASISFSAYSKRFATYSDSYWKPCIHLFLDKWLIKIPWRHFSVFNFCSKALADGLGLEKMARGRYNSKNWPNHRKQSQGVFLEINYSSVTFFSLIFPLSCLKFLVHNSCRFQHYLTSNLGIISYTSRMADFTKKRSVYISLS